MMTLPFRNLARLALLAIAITAAAHVLDSLALGLESARLGIASHQLGLPSIEAHP